MLKNLHLVNFRSYDNLSISFSSVTIIVGPNGIGKTNLIEAVYLLSTISSYRTVHTQELINFDKDFSRLAADFDQNLKIEFILQKQDTKISKTIKINGVEYRLSEAVGRFKAVLFGPESVEIVLGSPKNRRRFLDLILSQIDQKYLRYLIELKKIIKQRNKLLALIKNKQAEQNELDFWDKKLVEANHYVVERRIKLIDFFKSLVGVYYNKISADKNNLSIKYIATLPLATEANFSIGRAKEIEATQTLYGPHRDELSIYLNNFPASHFCSRGEARTLVLALKLAEIDYFAKENKQKPILLLDDVFSELDKNRIKHLMSAVNNQQTIITTTDVNDIDKFKMKDYKVVDLG